MEWVASTLHTTSEHVVSNTTTINSPSNTTIYYEEWLHVSILQGHHQAFIMNYYIKKAAYILGNPINVYNYKIGSKHVATFRN